jgi:hypothetical protein
LWKKRRFTNEWRIYTDKKLKNNAKKRDLENWLRVGYSAETIKLLQKYKVRSISNKEKISNFQNKFIQSKARGFLKYLYSVC